VLESDPQGISEEGHQDMGFDTRLQLVEQGPDR
jgi:hypothetical protein